ncbi:MAG: hypothetical protein AAF266_01065 [Planctomycetota bacterium]
MRLQLTLAALAVTCSFASATPTDLAQVTDLLTPSFRGDANTTWVGWDTFDDVDPNPLDSFHLIDDTTPDIGVNGGRFTTTNNEDHLSGSGNYYSGSGTVAEDITFDVDGVDGTGFTTIVVQGVTLFGGFGPPIFFSPIEGVLPTVTSTSDAPFTTTNADGNGQFFAKYEIPTGLTGQQTLSISTPPGGFSFTSFDKFVVDTVWSAAGFAPDSAIAVPEPAAAVLLVVAMAGLGFGRRS